MARISNCQRTRNLFTTSGKCNPPADSHLHQAITYRFQYLADINFVGEVRPSEFYFDFLRAITAHWIIKMRINTKAYKHPWGSEAIYHKPIADIYAVLWDCISAIKNFNAFKYADDYDCTSNWFSCILYEFAMVRNKKQGKKAVIEELQRNNQILTDIKNGKKNAPFWLDKIFDKEKHEHTYKLFEVLCMADPDLDKLMEAMRVELLSNVIKALKTYCQWVRQDVKGVIVPSNSGDYLIFGKGSHKEKRENVLINPESLSRIGFQSSNG